MLAWLDENADDVNKVREAFGFPSAADAEYVAARRARSLRRRGFENALRARARREKRTEEKTKTHTACSRGPSHAVR